MTSIDARAEIAAANNADLYEAVFTAHGLRYCRERFAFVAIDPPPPFYSALTTTTADVIPQAEAIAAARAKFGPRFGFKDSFCRHGDAIDGLIPLFSASWIFAAANHHPEADATDWVRVTDAAGLTAWERGWSASDGPVSTRMFPSSVLDDPNLIFLGLPSDSGFSAGCIANLSTDCVGISNIFCSDPAYPVHAAATRAVADLELGLPIVGYERGTDLDAMLAAGFEAVGDLRVWVAS